MTEYSILLALVCLMCAAVSIERLGSGADNTVRVMVGSMNEDGLVKDTVGPAAPAYKKIKKVEWRDDGHGIRFYPGGWNYHTSDSLLVASYHDSDRFGRLDSTGQSLSASWSREAESQLKYTMNLGSFEVQSFRYLNDNADDNTQDIFISDFVWSTANYDKAPVIDIHITLDEYGQQKISYFVGYAGLIATADSGDTSAAQLLVDASGILWGNGDSDRNNRWGTGAPPDVLGGQYIAGYNTKTREVTLTDAAESTASNRNSALEFTDYATAVNAYYALRHYAENGGLKTVSGRNADLVRG